MHEPNPAREIPEVSVASAWEAVGDALRSAMSQVDRELGINQVKADLGEEPRPGD